MSSSIPESLNKSHTIYQIYTNLKNLKSNGVRQKLTATVTYISIANLSLMRAYLPPSQKRIVNKNLKNHAQPTSSQTEFCFVIVNCFIPKLPEFHKYFLKIW